MSMQKAGQTPRYYVLSEEVAALHKLFDRGEALVVSGSQLQHVGSPLPHLDWPSNLFCDSLSN